MTLNRFVIVTIVVFAVASAKQQSNDFCSKQMIKMSKTNLESRFGKSSILDLCEKRNHWHNRANNPDPKVLSDPSFASTDKQLDWLQQVRSCSNPAECLGKDKAGVKTRRPVTPSDKTPPKPQLLRNRFKPKQLFREPVLQRKPRQVRFELKPVVRKEYRQMTDEERERFHKALNQLKADKIDGRSKYDILTVYHTPEHSPGAHWGPALLPWHRELLKQLEIALRSYDATISVPYWDSTLDEGLPEPKDSVLWTETFLGNGRGDVTTGPFGNWTVRHKIGSSKYIKRDVGRSQFGSLFQNADIVEVLKRKKFEDLTACVDPYFELVHGAVHAYVGGHMNEMAISVNDPSFFLHHSFIDYLWEQFRAKNQGKRLSELDYPKDARSCSQHHYASTMMMPFPKRNVDGLRNEYTNYFYKFADRPTCTRTKPDCGSEYLFCDTRYQRCLSKVQKGGNCTGFENLPICYDSVCVENLCEAVKIHFAKTSTVRKTTGTVTTKRVTPLPTKSGTKVTVATTATTTTTPKPKTTPKQKPKLIKDETTKLKPSRISVITTPLPTKSPKPTPGLRSAKTDCKCPCKPKQIFRDPGVDAGSPAMFPKSSTIWFPITILKGELKDFLKDLAKGVTVQSRDVATSRKQYGKLFPQQNDTYPYFPGAAAMRVANSLAKDGGTPVELELTVKDSDGDCQAYCYQEPSSYAKCTGKLKLHKDTLGQDSVAFADSAEKAVRLAWDGRKRRSTHFLFLCPSKPNSRSKSGDAKSSCRFFELPNFKLLDTANHTIEKTTSMEACKKLCRDANDKKLPRISSCSSITYQEKEKTCSISRDSRLKSPRNLRTDTSDVVYADYTCGRNSLCDGVH